MKKMTIPFIFVTLLVNSTSAYAQLVRGYEIKVGAVTANQSWHFKNISDLATDNRWGFTAAGFLEVFNLPVVSILGEVQYTQKGMKCTLPVTTVSQPDGWGEYITKSPRVDYLSVPLLIKIRFSTPFVTPYLIAGPRLDLLCYRNGDGAEAVIDNFETSESGATFGLGVELASLIPMNVLAEFRYNTSFKDSFNNNFLAVRNSSLDFMLGVKL